FAQIAADRFGVAPEDVEFRFGDSREVPRGVGTFASRSVAMGGSAVAQAVDALKEKCGAVAERLGAGASLREVAEAEPGLRASARFESDLVFSSGAYRAGVGIERAPARRRGLRLWGGC